MEDYLNEYTPETEINLNEITDLKIDYPLGPLKLTLKRVNSKREEYEVSITLENPEDIAFGGKGYTLLEKNAPLFKLETAFNLFEKRKQEFSGLSKLIEAA
ncbi:MAG: hypothetical protein Q8L27_02260 [archaeon]|nr:hypothetical protein [archaeon]